MMVLGNFKVGFEISGPKNIKYDTIFKAPTKFRKSRFWVKAAIWAKYTACESFESDIIFYVFGAAELESDLKIAQFSHF